MAHRLLLNGLLIENQVEMEVFRKPVYLKHIPLELVKIFG